MRVRLIEDDLYVHDVAAGTEFDVKVQDDGFYTGVSFYQGWIKTRTGRKIYTSYEKDQCEVIDWD